MPFALIFIGSEISTAVKSEAPIEPWQVPAHWASSDEIPNLHCYGTNSIKVTPVVTFGAPKQHRGSCTTLSSQVSAQNMKRSLNAQHGHENDSRCPDSKTGCSFWLSRCFDEQSPCFAVSSSKPNLHVFDSAVKGCLQTRHKTWDQKTWGLPFLSRHQVQDEGTFTAWSCLTF